MLGKLINLILILSLSGQAYGYPLYLKTTKVYKNIPGVRKNLLSLDIYYPEKKPEKPLPVLIYVHGGAWFLGDKSRNVKKKVELCKRLRFIFVSVNYRLTDKPVRGNFNPDRIKYPVFVEDVSDAVKWIRQNIAKYGGNPDMIFLMGHSAGAHMVALLGTSKRFLKLKEKQRYLKGVIALDGEYNVLERVRAGSIIFTNAFGNDIKTLKDASPIYNVRDSEKYPAFLLVTRGRRTRIRRAKKFAKKLLKAGAKVVIINANPYTHREVNLMIGDPRDSIITPPLEKFLRDLTVQ